MSDVTIQAQQARQQLAQALGALQQDNLPPNLETVAGLVARAMSLLHGVETKGETGATSAAALDTIRQALNVLQAPESAHPAADAALEHVAGSLSVVHRLNQILQTSDVAVSAKARAANPAPTDFSMAATTELVMPKMDRSPAATTPAVETAVTEEEAIPLTNPAPAHGSSTGLPKADRVSSNPQALPALAAQDGELFAEASLGAYSTTNFFKGLSGNDIVDAGGLFIATYDVPALEQAVRVRVTMPGGYEFEARGVVAWTREMPKTGSLNPMSPPGYGIRFTELSKEARQLVYRYVRNREPLFYDDL